MSGPSRVTFQRAPQAVRAIDTVPQTVAGFVGVTQRGPFSDQVVTSYAQYQALFGGPSLNSADMDLALINYFAEGGNIAHVARVVHFTDATNLLSKTSAPGSINLATATPLATSGAASSGVGPWALASGDQLTFKVDGGSVQTVTFTGTAAARASGAGTFNLSDGQTLTVSISSGPVQTITFHTAMFNSIAAATPAEVVAVLNAYFASNSIPAVATVTSSTHVTITANQLGLGSGVNVTGGSANTALGFTTSNIAGTGNVSNLAAVTAAEVAAAIAAVPITGGVASNTSTVATITSSTTGLSSTVQVTAAGAAGAKLGFDLAPHAGIAAVAQNTLTVNAKTDGTYANVLTVQTAAASNGKSDHFNLYVLSSGVIVERFFNLSLNSSATDYAMLVVNTGYSTQGASNLITLTDDFSTVPSPGNLPSLGTFGPLTGGADGLAGLADADYAGANGTNGATGMHVFDQAPEMNLLVVPGRATAATANAQINYCEQVRTQLCYTILDPPAGLSCAQAVTYFSQTASVVNLSQMSAAYYPRIKVANPNTTVFGTATTLTTGAAGALAGLYARTDSSKVGGAFEQPASIETGVLRTALGLEDTTDVRNDTQRGILFDSLINPIMVKKGTPVYVDGARGLLATAPFPSVGESRGMLFVAYSIIQATDPKRNQNLRPRWYNEITMAVETFLSALTKAQSFASNDDATAWFFDGGTALNTPAVQATGTGSFRFGLALSKPAEFVAFVASPFSAPTPNTTNAAA